MIDLPSNFVAYFGTTNYGSGHNLYILEGYEVFSGIDTCDWGAVFDRDWILQNLSVNSLKVFWWENADVTIVGYPKSLDDKRPGSKSLFILRGNHVGDNDYIVAKMKESPWVYDIFSKLVDKYLKAK